MALNLVLLLLDADTVLCSKFIIKFYVFVCTFFVRTRNLVLAYVCPSIAYVYLELIGDSKEMSYYMCTSYLERYL